MNKKFSKRRIALTAVLAVLVLVYALLSWSSSRTGIKIVRTEAEPSEITITRGMNAQDEIRLEKNGDGEWTVGSKKYPADENAVFSITNALSQIKILGTASSAAGDGSRYGLDDGAKITVSASANGKSLLTVAVGKNTSTGNQSYIQLNGKNAVLLANQALHSIFDTTEDALRSKKVYALSPSEISSVTASGKDGSFTVKKETVAQESGGDENAPLPTAWVLANPAGEKVSSEKISAWVNTVCAVSVSAWLDEASGSANAGGDEFTLALEAGGKRYEVRILAEEQVSETETKYLCASNQSPYLFYLSPYTAGNIKKSLADFAD